MPGSVTHISMLKAVFLGFVQGLTEFLPVSSSGHLVLFQKLFGLKEPMLSFDIALHAGTLLAVLIYFRKEVAETFSGFWGFLSKCFCPCAYTAPISTGGKLWLDVLLTLVPTGVIAILFKHRIEALFSNLTAVSCAWLLMGMLLITSARLKEGTVTLERIGLRRALWIGFTQGVALIPGISRSGSTILGGMVAGIKKEDAARFSFLISVPAILAAIVMDLKEGSAYFSSNGTAVLTGFFASAVTGYAVVKWLMGVIHKGRFFIFGYYCLALGFLSLILAHFVL